MTYANVFTKATRDRALGMMVAVFAVALTLLATLSLYQSVDVSFYYELPDAYLALLGLPEDGGVTGLAYGAYFNTLGALALAGVAISIGAAGVAKEESNGTMGLLLGNPISRSEVVISKAGSMLFLATSAAVVLWGAAYLIPEMLDQPIDGVHVGALVIHLLANTLFYGALALCLSAWTGNAGLASGVSVGVMVAGWVAVGILPLLEGLDWLIRLFPWYYYNGSQPMTNGTNWGHVAALAGASVVLTGIGIRGLNGRDLKSQGVRRTAIDRLRDNPKTARLAERMAGSARVSGLATKTASDHQGLLLATSAILFYFGVLIGAFWGWLPDSIFEALEQFPDALLAIMGGADMSTPEGWFQAETFSVTAPIVMFLLTIVVGSRALAGEEEKQTMSLLMSNPIRRSSILLKKAAVMVVLAFALGAATFAGNWLGAVLGGAKIGWSDLAATSVLLTLIGLVIGGVALLVGAATGRPKLASFVAVGAAFVSYFMFAFLPLSHSLSGWVQWSPYHYYLGGEPLLNGMDWGDAAFLTALFSGLVLLSVPLFERRDLRG